MKKILTLCLIALLFSCKKTPEQKPPPPKPEPVKEVVKEVVEEKKEAPVKKVDNTLVKLQKKACSGDCPVFDVTITKDSVFTYHGKRFTNVEGVRKVKLTGKQYDRITKIIADSNFSTLKNRYTKSGTQDFSESVITHQGKKVTVRLWKDAPKKLTAIYVFIEDILYGKKYLE
jgi:hypothetical protein